MANIATIYYLRLQKTLNKVPVLVAFLQEATGIEAQSSLYGLVGKLYKMFGEDIVFEAITVLGVSSANLETNIAGYLTAICKNIFKEKMNSTNSSDLTSMAEKNYKEMYGNRRY